MWNWLLDWAVKRRTGLTTRQIHSLTIRSAALCRAIRDKDEGQIRIKTVLVRGTLLSAVPEIYELYFGQIKAA